MNKQRMDLLTLFRELLMLRVMMLLLSPGRVSERMDRMERVLSFFDTLSHLVILFS